MPTRLVTLFSLCCFLVCDAVVSDGVMGVAVSFSAASALLLLYPLPDEGWRLSLGFMACLAALSCLLKFASSGLVLPFIVQAASLLAYVCVRNLKKYSAVKAVCLTSSMWLDLLGYVMLFHIAVYLLMLMAVLGLSLSHPSAAGWVGVPLFAASYCILYYKAYSGRTVFLDSRTEDDVKCVAKPSPVMKAMMSTPTPETKMTALYRRVLAVMEKEKPYLNEDLDLNTLSRMAYSNKTYLSRTIHLFSGRTFCAFINYYRIEYAAGLFDKDPRLKVKDVSAMSGFKNVASFNMAFKLNKGITPSEYIEQVRKVNL